MHVIASKAVCFKEALRDEFKNYQKQIVKNAKVLSESLMKLGFKLVSDGTDNHLMLIDLRNKGITGKDLEYKLDEIGITVNKNSIPFDTEKPTITSGIRVGTPAVTSRGMQEEDMKEIAELIYLTATDFENSRASIQLRVKTLCDKYPLYQ